MPAIPVGRRAVRKTEYARSLTAVNYGAYTHSNRNVADRRDPGGTGWPGLRDSPRSPGNGMQSAQCHSCCLTCWPCSPELSQVRPAAWWGVR
jgi:hypothetical protein